jgi:amino acid adenylation domain-containing protein
MLRLPYDRIRPATAARVYCAVPLDAEETADLIAALGPAAVAAAFLVQLSRYSGQEEFSVDFSHAGVAGSSFHHSAEFDLGALPELTCGAVAARVAAVLDDLRLQPNGRSVSNVSIALFADQVELFGQLQADLQLRLPLASGAHSALLVFNETVLDRATVERMARHLGRVLAQLVQEPNVAVATIELASEEERQQLMEIGTGCAQKFPAAPAHVLFERNVREAPGNTAVRYLNQHINYASLNDAANCLAQQLLAEGVQKADRVVVCVQPCAQITAAILAIFKIGAVYVPIDPTYPVNRIEAIIRETQPQVVLSSRVSRRVLQTTSLPLLELDALYDKTDGSSAPNPDIEVGIADVAYIYFTSGSTGTPKGVLATHANLINYVFAARSSYGFTAADIMPAMARFTFSISMFELMLPVVAGGCTRILDREIILDPGRILRVFGEVTFIHAGPSLLRGLMAHLKQYAMPVDTFDRVRHISSGGDMIPPELLDDLTRVFRQAEVFAIYGCSEISCMGCTHQVDRSAPVTRTVVGGPMSNVLLRVVDPAGRSVPLGCVGEICFGGDGVVKGYLNLAEQTAERFFEVEGARFYRTGDVGRILASGDLEMLGRKDFQVQVRGMRIELGEIEHALRSAPGVREAVASSHRDATGEAVLVAYLVPQPGQGVDRRELRQFLVQVLPDYMIPAIYMELERLPLNHNMKVDRKALPVPTAEVRRGGGASAFRQPHTATARTLARIWEELLGVGPVGLGDNFFDLGAHSLLGMSLIARVEKEIGAKLDGMDVLRENLEVLARICDQGRLAGASDATPSISILPGGNGQECLYFGGGEDLYGVYFAASAASQVSRSAVVLCMPIGEESTRTSFVARRFALRLAERGVPVLRFDFFGTGDSGGDLSQSSVSRWIEDVVAAARVLRDKSGASSIIGVGVRLGATLLCAAAARAGISEQVYWDPVESGAEYVDELRSMHARYLESTTPMRGLGKRRAPPVGEELLGAVYAPELVRSISELNLLQCVGATDISRVSWMATGAAAARAANRWQKQLVSGLQMVSTTHECAWNDLANYSSVLPDAAFSETLSKLVLRQ